MKGCWLGGFLITGLWVTMVNSNLDLDSPLRVAHCRAFCLHKIHITPPTDAACQASTGCSQCWELCMTLQTEANLNKICSQQECGPACQEACHFYSARPVERPPFPVVVEEVLEVQEEEGVVRWPAVQGAVFLVLADSQLRQTLEPRVRIPGETVRVWVLDWRGLTRVFCQSPPSPLLQLQAVVRSLGLEKKILVRQKGNKRLRNQNSTKLTSSFETQPTKPWRLREESMVFQSELVLTQIRWESQQQSGVDSQLMYLVTWQVDGGVLRGNLLTHSTYVTLSLWPDTVYTIQVALLSLDSAGSQSEPLVLDTHLVHTDSPSAIHSSLDIGRKSSIDSRTQMVAVVAAASTMFLFLTLVLTWRWRHRLSLPHSKLVDEEVGTPNIYRVFPPVLRLLGERKKGPANLFASTDNLIQDQPLQDHT